MFSSVPSLWLQSILLLLTRLKPKQREYMCKFADFCEPPPPLIKFYLFGFQTAHCGEC